MEIEIFTKDEFDKESENVTRLFNEYGGKGKIKVSKVYKIEADENIDYFKKISEDLLIDNIVEFYTLRFENRANFVIDMFLKKGVSDVVGESVKMAVKDMDLNMPKDVRTGKRFYFYSNDKELAKEFIMEEFANELIHKIDLKQE